MNRNSLRALTCLCPVRSSRKVSRFGGGPAPCVFCTLDTHACGEEGNYASISNQSMNVQVLHSAPTVWRWGLWRRITIHWRQSTSEQVRLNIWNIKYSILQVRLYTFTWANILVIILLFLLSPVLVKLVDFHSSISLLNQVESLHNTHT